MLPGISALRGTPDDPLPIGASTVLQVTANPQDGVTDPGPITFPLVSEGVSIVGYPSKLPTPGPPLGASPSSTAPDR